VSSLIFSALQEWQIDSPGFLGRRSDLKRTISTAFKTDDRGVRYHWLGIFHQNAAPFNPLQWGSNVLFASQFVI
jgi:hypothetical protein